jgi:hypothetical protein
MYTVYDSAVHTSKTESRGVILLHMNRCLMLCKDHVNDFIYTSFNVTEEDTLI